MTFFLVVTLFCHFCPSVFSYFTLYNPYMHTHMLFSRFSTLLCVLVTVDTAYTIYFVLIHHCTNSLSSLHTKTSPVYSQCSPQISSYICMQTLSMIYVPT